MDLCMDQVEVDICHMDRIHSFHMDLPDPLGLLRRGQTGPDL